jgi:hypothetical protein
MAVRLEEHAKELSTYVVQVHFWDENGVAVAPSAITWSLKDEAQAVVNSRSAVVFSVPASSIDIPLSGNDLAVAGYTGSDRRLQVNATYTSVLGVLPIVESVWFTVDPQAEA